MAKLKPGAYPGNWQIDYTGDLDSQLRAVDLEFDRLYARQPGHNAESLVGAMVCQPVADGRAWYIVVADKPVTLQHIPVGDAWEADAAWIRGLRASDIRATLKRQQNLNELLGG